MELEIKLICLLTVTIRVRRAEVGNETETG